MSNADDIYESINKDWFYYDEKHDRIYYQKQKQLCEDFINESRKEQHQLIDEINHLQQLIQQKQHQSETLQMRKELIKDRVVKLEDELTTYEPDKRRYNDTN